MIRDRRERSKNYYRFDKCMTFLTLQRAGANALSIYFKN